MIVQALVVDKPGDPFVYQDIQLEDTIRDDEVLVEMKATGVCHTDLNFSKETQMPDMFPVVLGHEGIESSLVTLAHLTLTQSSAVWRKLTTLRRGRCPEDRVESHKCCRRGSCHYHVQLLWKMQVLRQPRDICLR
jgi:D-arabinose 1-dehydrogenase-like Zn-dependent alcohol dehydrogenase